MSGNNSTDWPWLPFGLSGSPLQPQAGGSGVQPPQQLALLQQNQAPMPPSAQVPWPSPQPRMTWDQQQRIVNYLQSRFSPRVLSDSPSPGYYANGLQPERPYLLPNSPDMGNFGYRDPMTTDPFTAWLRGQWNSHFGQFAPWNPPQRRGT